MQQSNQTSPWLVILIVFIGVIAISTGAILVRLATASAGITRVGFSLVISSARLTFSALIILPMWSTIKWRSLQKEALFYAGMAGICLAFHFAAWITSLSYTSITASTTLVTTCPIWVAILSKIWLNENLSKLTRIGIAIALSGGLIIGLGDVQSQSQSPNPLLGNSLALIGALTISCYFILGRESQQRGLTTGGYIAIAYTVAACLLFPLPFFFQTGYIGYPKIVYLYLILTAILPQLVGHTSLNWAVNRMSPTFVTLVTLFEPVIASLLGYVFFQEVPSLIVLVGAGVILTGVAFASIGSKSNN